MWGTEGSGLRPLRWLPGTSRVAPLASVKSSTIHMTLATMAAEIGPSAGLGSVELPVPRLRSATGTGGSAGLTGGGIHHWSVWSAMAVLPGSWIWASTQETR